MIKSKEHLLEYLESDRKALGRNGSPHFFDIVFKFERALRYYEYYKNCYNGSLYMKIMRKYYYWRFNTLSILCGFTIYPNSFGKGLSIAHRGTIVVNQSAKIGENCRLHVGVNIGTIPGCSKVAPTIGDNVYIAPGVKIYGKISIANGIIIGANSVVNKSFEEEDICIAGVPAQKISNLGRDKIIARNQNLYPDYI